MGLTDTQTSRRFAFPFFYLEKRHRRHRPRPGRPRPSANRVDESPLSAFHRLRQPAKSCGPESKAPAWNERSRGKSESKILPLHPSSSPQPFQTTATNRLFGLGRGRLCHRLQDEVVAAFCDGIYRLSTHPAKKKVFPLSMISPCSLHCENCDFGLLVKSEAPIGGFDGSPRPRKSKIMENQWRFI